MMRYKQVKKFYKRYEVYIAVSVIVFALLSVASIGRLQSSFSTSGIWDASAEIGGVSVNGQHTTYDSFSGIEKSKNKVSWDPDGSATSDSLTTMSSAGLMPQVEVTVGALFHVNAVGTPVKTTGPNEIEDIDGTRYVRYYLGFSISLLTRGQHPDIPFIENFDYYGEIIRLFENPNFAGITLGGDIGIKLAKIDETVPTICGVQSFTMLDYETRYTTAAGQGYSDDITDFNREYEWDENYAHEGSVSAPSEYSMYSFYDLDADYSGRVDLESTLVAGSEYIPTWYWGSMTGGTFNVWDVELLAHFMCEVLLTYEIAADVDGYLEGRLDIGGIAEPEVYDLFYYIALFISNILDAIMSIFGLANIWVALAVLIGLIVAAIIVMIMVKKILFGGGGGTRTVYGY